MAALVALIALMTVAMINKLHLCTGDLISWAVIPSSRTGG